ncbi:sialate O-acetylesterase [Spirosoma sp.]|uniref:sialate O-acetylesterase n=1 Tax=Spirosoma sp. TaxID=1899569 RepID=UPI003B3A58E2
MPRLCLFLLFTACTGITWAVAQIDVTYPVSRMVIQRNNTNSATVQIAGSYAQPLDVVEARFVVRTIGQGTTTAWTTLQNKPINGQFNGTINVRGGWYRIEVRGLRNGRLVATDSVDRFGVGEVFAIVGHSNAQGSGCVINGVDECPTMPGATDDRVNVVALDQSSTDFQQYLTTADTRHLPDLVFSQLQTFSGMAPFAKMAWFWGRMGDVLVQRINVPVLIYNAGFGGSNMEQTYKAAYDIPFTHNFIPYRLRMPFANLRNLMNLYVPSTGIRAILLNHGENDRENPVDQILTHHYGVIDKARQEFNKPDLAWIIALSSFAGKPFENVRSAQQQVIHRVGYDTFQGPDLDSIMSTADRPDGIHYSPLGQAKAGERWANAITDELLKAITPYEAQLQPLITIACATNNQLQLIQPPGADYSWNTGGSSQKLTVGTGTYSARLRSGTSQIFFPPSVTIANEKPFIESVQAGSSSSDRTLPGIATFQVKNSVYSCFTDLLLPY